jgi:hypothetical protein
MRQRRFVLATLALIASCKPELGERESRITHPVILSVRGDPPEAKPGERVSYSLLVATPDGPAPAPTAGWAFCATPKLLGENGAASASCMSGAAVRPIAEQASVALAATPQDACALFGPEVTSADLRPRDPDVTGGFYQPVRVSVGETVAIGLERVACKIANASALDAADYGKRYVANKNPELLPLVALRAGQPLALDAVPRGATITLRASWPESSAERYVVYDLERGAVVEHRESLRVSWFATEGTFADDRTGRAEEELATFTDDEWTAPDATVTVHLFVVLRDARGGVAFATYDIKVE